MKRPSEPSYITLVKSEGFCGGVDVLSSPHGVPFFFPLNIRMCSFCYQSSFLFWWTMATADSTQYGEYGTLRIEVVVVCGRGHGRRAGLAGFGALV